MIRLPQTLPYRGIIFDLDGTIYRGDRVLPGAVTVVAALRERSRRIVFLSNPDNPTGTAFGRAALEELLARAPEDVLVVHDEAYFEFSKQTLVGELGRFPNLMVVRTLSKAFRLAAVRLGYGMASPAVLEQLRRVRMPYAQSTFTQVAATIALRRRERLLDVVDKLAGERERISAALAEIEGVEVFPSGANFVLFRHPAPDRALEALGAKGIVIRDFTHLGGCEGCLRVSTGTPAQNDEFLGVLASL